MTSTRIDIKLCLEAIPEWDKLIYTACWGVFSIKEFPSRNNDATLVDDEDLGIAASVDHVAGLGRNPKLALGKLFRDCFFIRFVVSGLADLFKFDSIWQDISVCHKPFVAVWRLPIPRWFIALLTTASSFLVIIRRLCFDLNDAVQNDLVVI